MSHSIHTVTHTDAGTHARCGILELAHGPIETPAFMPVGTNGTVKGIYHEKVEQMGYRLILGNTYHLYLRPGCDVLESYGGLHAFSSWKHNILTDSGGFQVFSLSKLRKIKDAGVTFQSHIDGSRHAFTPEKVIDIQTLIGSDIAMVLDVCTPPDIDFRAAQEAWRVTRLWAERSITRRDENGERFRGNLFGIVQGNFYKELRKESAEVISSMDFPGIAIGGLSVGESPEQFSDFLAYTSEMVTSTKPRYVMGIGSPDYIFDAVANGIDLFDCVLATRTARHGLLFSDDGPVNITKAVHEFSKEPVEVTCGCTACTQYSRGYLRHLFKAGEMLGPMLATEHNLTYLHTLMERIKASIRTDSFTGFRKEYLARYYGGKKNA